MKKANQVAHFLIEKGTKPNDIVAISLERSLDMMVYIYGILKAGAAYLPLDTAIPTERFAIYFRKIQGLKYYCSITMP